jgi:hypothetical protein
MVAAWGPTKVGPYNLIAAWDSPICMVDVPFGAAAGTNRFVTFTPSSSAMKVPGSTKDENFTVNAVMGATVGGQGTGD